MILKETPKLEVELREKLGSRYAARVRNEGKIPAVVYGHKKGPVHVQVEYKPLVALLRDNAHLIDVVVGGETEHCVVKDMQWDYLGDTLVHIDFERVDLAEKVTVEVDVVLKGEPKALSEAGAFLDNPLVKIELACRADSIPEKLTVDVSELEAGKAITVADLELPEGIKATADAETVIAQVKVAKEEAVEETATEGEEPEVIGKDEKEAE